MPNRLARLLEVRQAKQIDACLVTHLPGICHLCGYFFNFETGPSPFHLLPAALLAIPGGEAGLLAADSEGGQLSAVDPKIIIRQYASYVYLTPIDSTRQFLEGLKSLVGEFHLEHSRLGIQPDSLPAGVEQFLHVTFPNMQLVDVGREVNRLRWIKDPDEVEKIRRAVHLCDVGQETLLREVRPGMSELDLFARVRSAMEAAAQKRFPLMADLVSGPRTGEAGGSPGPRIIEPGDLILSDLTPCLDGYWGDTCNTMVAGTPTGEQRAAFQQVQEALELGIAAVRPGVKACEVDRLMREHLARAGGFPHHGGHGVGVVYHEEPRIVPYNDLELAPNMVVALEPGFYQGEQGMRLEHLLRVTETGCELLSQFHHRLSAE